MTLGRFLKLLLLARLGDDFSTSAFVDTFNEIVDEDLVINL